MVSKFPLKSMRSDDTVGNEARATRLIFHICITMLANVDAKQFRAKTTK